jgi:hypothetical protein
MFPDDHLVVDWLAFALTPRGTHDTPVAMDEWWLRRLSLRGVRNRTWNN